MQEKHLFDALDGLFAYDSGCVSSGIHDVLLKEQVVNVLKSELEKPELRHHMYPPVIDRYILSMLNGIYGTEDVKKFIEWLDNLMGY